jgi:hypothetical protein
MRGRRVVPLRVLRAYALGNARPRGGFCRRLRACHPFGRDGHIRELPSRAHSRRSRERTALACEDPALSASAHGFNPFRRNSETLTPAAFAFLASLRCSSSDSRSCTNLVFLSAFGFGGRPIVRFLFNAVTVEVPVPMFPISRQTRHWRAGTTELRGVWIIDSPKTTGMQRQVCD